jgi:hypothetical protein
MATDAVANQPVSKAQAVVNPAVLVATPSLIALSNPPLEIDIMADLIFENIGGQELINISRNDIINGQDVLYSPIKNLQSLYLEYNPNNIIKLENTADTYFKNFPIRLENKIPTSGSGPNGEIVYIDDQTGDLIINIINLDSDEQVDVQILNSGEILNGTIYGAV